ncbi:MAG: sugar phosphate isomerase/epimerase family protein [Marinirhabdus sp.]
MKKATLALLLLLGLLSCKDTPSTTTGTETTGTTGTETTEKTAELPSVYRLSLAQWSLNKPIFAGTKDPMDFASDAKNMGFEGLEYVSQLYTNEAVKFPMKGAGLQNILEELKRRSDSLGMRNVLIMVDGEGDLSFSDGAATQTAIENHKKWIDAAAFLGCHSIRVNLFGEEDPEAWEKNSVAALKQLGAIAAEKNINIIVENHGGHSSHGARLARVMQQVAMDNVGTLPDFGNFCVAREGGERWGAPCVETYDMYQGIKEIMPYAKGVSAKSYAFDEQGNETKIDYHKMMQLLKALWA